MRITEKFYTPKTAKELRAWLGVHYPKGSFSGMKKKQLYAIFFKEIRKFCK